MEKNKISYFQTPETYLGYARAQNFKSPEMMSHNTIASYTYPNRLKLNDWALQGSFKIESERIISTEPSASIKIHFYAGRVFVVMGSIDGNPIEVKVLVNGEPPINPNKSRFIVKDHTLYEVIAFEKNTTAILELILEKAGVEVYTFTFGGSD